MEELVEKINSIFSGNKEDAIQLSTVHKAKGLEADNVFILCPSLMPSKIAKKDWEWETEKNLIYVAYTRAKKSLNFLSEADYSKVKNTYSNPESIIKRLENIRKKIIFNTELGVSEKYYDSTGKTNTVITLGEKAKQEEKPFVNNNKKVKGGLKMKNLLS